MDIPELYRIFLRNKLICTDTRKIERNCIFFALRGTQFNGNDFAAEALSKGAIRAVVDDKKLTQDSRHIRVENVLGTLQKLSAFHRKKTGCKILAVTGSNGKTTTKELCKAVLSKRYRVHATEGNLNNHIGVPLTLLEMEQDTEIGIVEMGANHPGEIALLCEIAQPDCGLITNIGKAHLEGFGGIEGVVKTKGELFSYLIKNEKTIYINEGDAYVNQLLSGKCDKCFFYNGERGIYARHISSNPFVELEIVVHKQILNIKTQLIGRYNAENVLAACCVGMHEGIPDHEIAHAISTYQSHGYRSQLIQSEQNKIFLDAYNANPSSMLAAIDEFLAFPDDKKLVILGEMKEIGDQSHAEHEGILSYLRNRNVSDVICVGESFRFPSREAGFLYFEDVDALMDHIRRHQVTDSLVFIKGSRSNRLEKIMDLL